MGNTEMRPLTREQAARFRAALKADALAHPPADDSDDTADWPIPPDVGGEATADAPDLVTQIQTTLAREVEDELERERRHGGAG